MSFATRLLDSFKAHADDKIAAWQAAYMRHQFIFLGIPTPLRRQLQKQHFEKLEEPLLLETIQQLYSFKPRECRYAAIDLLQQHVLSDRFLKPLTTLIQTDSWWDTVDTLASQLLGKLVALHPSLISLVTAWADHEDLWMRRSALLFQLRYKQKTDTKLLFSLCQKLAHEKEFFIQKAIGWTLREYAKTDAAAVIDFVQMTSLSSLSKKEALKHVRSHLKR